MDLGVLGLCRMGANMAERLTRGGHRVVGYDRDAAARRALSERGAETAESVDALVALLRPPRTVWLIVPAGVVDPVLHDLASRLAEGDVVIDGGNSNYRETLRRAAALRERGRHYVDVGTSGGVWGLQEGYSLMVGGEQDTVERLRPLFETLAPAPDRGWRRVGPVGSGHFTKDGAQRHRIRHDAGLRGGLRYSGAEGRVRTRPASGRRDLAPRQRRTLVAARPDRRGVAGDPGLATVRPYVEDSGEGRWMVAEAIDLDVPAPVITLALQARLRSRVQNSFADRLLAVCASSSVGTPCAGTSEIATRHALSRPRRWRQFLFRRKELLAGKYAARWTKQSLPLS